MKPERPHYARPEDAPAHLATRGALLRDGLEPVHAAVATTTTADGARELLYERAGAEPRVAPTVNPAPRARTAATPERAPITAFKFNPEVAAQVRRWLEVEDALILDTETTGGGAHAEVLEIGIVDASGRTVFETLVRPDAKVSPGARRVHRISDAMLRDAPRWAEIDEALRETLRGRLVLAYNVAFDQRMVEQTRRIHGFAASLHARWACAARAYAGVRRVRLTGLERAAALEGVLRGAQAHRAVGDARLTLEVLRAVSRE
jgi:DNA polymerase III epsilon subunit-like protein